MEEGIILEIIDDKAIILTSTGEFKTINNSKGYEVGKRVNYSINKNKSKTRGLAIIALIASLILFLIPFNINKVNAYVTIDINPSLKLELNETLVKKIIPLNDDAVRLINNLKDVNNKDIYYVTKEILAEAEEMGYIKKEEVNYVLVGIYEQEKKLDLHKLEMVIDKAPSNTIKVETIILEANKTEKEEAEKERITIGKYLIKNELNKQGIEINTEEINNSSVKEINEYIQNMGNLIDNDKKQEKKEEGSEEKNLEHQGLSGQKIDTKNENKDNENDHKNNDEMKNNQINMNNINMNSGLNKNTNKISESILEFINKNEDNKPDEDNKSDDGKSISESKKNNDENGSEKKQKNKKDN